MPPRKRYHCTYVKTWTAVKWRWSLTVNQAKKKKLRSVMKNRCSSLTIAKPKRANT